MDVLPKYLSVKNELLCKANYLIPCSPPRILFVNSDFNVTVLPEMPHTHFCPKSSPPVPFSLLEQLLACAPVGSDNGSSYTFTNRSLWSVGTRIQNHSLLPHPTMHTHTLG